MTVFGWFLVVFSRIFRDQRSEIRDQPPGIREQGVAGRRELGGFFVFSVLENRGIELPDLGESKASPYILTCRPRELFRLPGCLRERSASCP
jgi:hypothetical protein